MENSDTRGQILAELIDKMHSRLADKAYPAEKAAEPVEDKPEGAAEPKPEAEEEISEADIDALMESAE